MIHIPRLPLEGRLDLTYRCNNSCLHCWLWQPLNSPVRWNELTFEEIRRIADDARALGTRRWSISGGEPMLRPDFCEVFDYLTRKSTGYSLNSNGTLITPAIAKLLTRKGSKMIALYGATAEVYDAVTRHPGGFEKAMRGFAYLREAGAEFIVQLTPMRANWHEWDRMKELARSLSPHWRVGAPWLYLSSDGSRRRNEEIAGQRLTPGDVIELDRPNVAYEERMTETQTELSSQATCRSTPNDDRLFAECIKGRSVFHIDPYGTMSWCSFIKNPALRYDLRKGTFREAWEEFIPAVPDRVRGGEEYRSGCRACERLSDCRWCPAYAYLEAGRYAARIPYLCAVAEESRRFKREWKDKHRRYFRVADITVRVECDVDFDSVSLREEFTPFVTRGPGEDNVTIRHVFEYPDLEGKDLGEEIVRKQPWKISQRSGKWFYAISPPEAETPLRALAIFNESHAHGTIYNPSSDSLSLPGEDEVWLATLLADRNGLLFRSAALILNGAGLLFLGPSGAARSAIVSMMRDKAQILSDGFNIARCREEGWRVHGTWMHGKVSEVSSSSAPLRAILFLKKGGGTEIAPLTDCRFIRRSLRAKLVRPMVEAVWRRKGPKVLDRIAGVVPCYTFHFNENTKIGTELEKLTKETSTGRPACELPVLRSSSGIS